VSTSQPDQRFDLTDISQRLWLKWLRGKWMMGLVGVSVCVVVSLAFLYRAAISSTGGDFLYLGSSDLVLFGLFAIGGGLISWSQILVSKPASAVVVSQRGVEIQYPSYAPMRLDWTDRSFRLRTSPGHYFALDRDLSCAQFWWKPRAFLPEEVVAAIATSARGHGLDVRTVKDPNSVTGEGMVIRATRPRAR